MLGTGQGTLLVDNDKTFGPLFRVFGQRDLKGADRHRDQPVITKDADEFDQRSRPKHLLGLGHVHATGGADGHGVDALIGFVFIDVDPWRAEASGNGSTLR